MDRDLQQFEFFAANSERESAEWAFAFAKGLKTGDVVALEGDLGAGKTAICRGICKGLGFEGVSSPSYAIVNEYQNTPPIYHLDLYRLKSAEDLQDIGIETFAYPNGITLIEWPQMAGDFPLNIKYHIKIKITGENKREITIKNWRQIYISLGSNIEPREEMISQARELLKAERFRDWQESKVYETEPWGETEQAKFLNQAIGFKSEKTPLELLKICKDIEKKIGRQEREKWKEREVDLDLLYCGELMFKNKYLKLPHPYVSQREFVLMPLNDIAPNFEDPKTKLLVKDMLAALKPLN